MWATISKGQSIGLLKVALDPKLGLLGLVNMLVDKLLTRMPMVLVEMWPGLHLALLLVMGQLLSQTDQMPIRIVGP